MFIRVAGVQSGPFKAEDVKLRYHQGTLDRRAMSWCEGERRWISLGKRWPIYQGTATALCWIGVALVAAGSAAATALSQLKMLPFALQTGTTMLLLVVILATVTCAGLYMAWRVSARARRRSLMTVMLAISAMATLVYSIGLAGLSYPILTLRQRAPNAEVVYESATNSVRIQGPVGARLNEQVHHTMHLHPDTRTIVLDSPGGLVDDALDLAKFIRKNSIAARIDGTCASACVAIWAASPTRTISASSVIGIHQLQLGGNMPPQVSESARVDEQKQYDDYLRGAGFTDQQIQQGDQTPPAGMYWLNPVQAVTNAVHAVIVDDNGVAISPDLAKWLWVEHALGKGNSVSNLLLTIRLHAPQLVFRHANGIYDALIGGNQLLAKQAMQALSADALVFALRLATDEATVTWARSLEKIIPDDGTERSFCYMAAIDDQPTKGAGMPKLANSFIDNLSVLLSTTAVGDQAHRLPIPETAAIDSLFRESFGYAREMGLPTDTSKWSAPNWCQFRLSYFSRTLRLPAPEAAQAIRYMMLND